MGPVRVSSAIEVERKYAVADSPPGLPALPALHTLAGVVSAEVRPAVVLEAVYLDTADRSLLGSGVVVRRRTGGSDAGWHVKLRGTTGRTELHAPIDEQAPERLPPEFAAALRSRLRGRALVPIARIRTERSAVVVTDEAGGAVEVVDDRVTATDVAAGVLRSWREWEAEQADDCDACRALLERIDAVLLRAGARPSESPAKIAQALGLVGAERAARPPDTAGAVLAARVAEHTEHLHRGLQTLALDGDPDGATVHTLRKTVRRMRSLLALEPVAGPAGSALRDRLRAVGGVLGDARDPRVAAGVGARLLDDLPPDTPGLDAARALLVADPIRALDVGALAGRLGSDEVLAVLVDLERFTPDGALAAADPAALTPLAKREVRRARRRGRTSVGLKSLHRARKAARRARFVVAELAEVLPPTSTRAARRAAAVQDALGAHRDLALLLDALPDASLRLTASGGNAYALGLIAERGRVRLAELRRRAQRTLRRLP